MRTTLTLLAALPLAGCNLFRSAFIGTTCEDLPGQCGTVDTGPGDTFDTAPWVPEPPTTLGLVLCSLADDGIWLRAVLPDGEIVKEAHFASAELRPGAVTYDPVEDRLFLWDDAAETLWLVGGEGEVEAIEAADLDVGQIYGMRLFEGALYMVSDDAVWRWTAGAWALERLTTTSAFHMLRGIFPSAVADSLLLLDLGADDAPDLYRLTASSADSVLVYEDFDSETGRVASGFMGPAMNPHVCSSVGAIYAVEDLHDGDRTPLVFPDQDSLALEFEGVEIAGDTTDCAWDDGAERFLIHSVQVGVLALDAWGHVEVLARPDGGEKFIRGSFFLPVATD